MLRALAIAPDGSSVVQGLNAEGVPVSSPERFTSAAEAVLAYEEAERPRWVWAATGNAYPVLLSAGLRVDRCHDLALCEAILLGYDERWGEPRSLAAVWARLHGQPVPADPQPRLPDHQPTLFEPDRAGLPDGVDPLAAVVQAYA
ncbi:MAG TPA: hypothetical protein VGR21_05865, partial [Cryptosporangiaceae bacterium]|nr:hypothetical protein [Cryptosporangiaceae bacterium]